MNERMVGQEIEAYCGKCKDDTVHLITAVTVTKINKVMCKTCMSYHGYKKPTNGETTTIAKDKSIQPKKRKTMRTRRTKAAQLLEEANIDSAIDYKMTQTYEAETAINHKKFGLGIVKSVIDDQKIEVLFEDGERVLIQNVQN